MLRTIRFDGTDERVFETAAAEDEIAVTGGFAFAGLHPDDVTGKVRQAFANGFLGLGSFGRATFASVAEVTDADRAAAHANLAAHLEDEYGAPNRQAAEAAAEDELTFAESLCADVEINTVFTIRRTRDDAGEIVEEFRTIKAPSGEPMHARIWTLVDDDA
ncbi:MAG: DUF6505 family protein [Pseudomonadota bacterium]